MGISTFTLAEQLPRVAVSIAPIHSLVSNVMQGVTEPELLYPLTGSPHSQALLPNSVSTLYQSDLVIWVGPSFEVSMKKVVSSLDETKIKTLRRDLGLKFLNNRLPGHWHLENNDTHPLPIGESHGGYDPHIWLSPKYSQDVVEKTVQWLQEIDPDHAEIYATNGAKTIKKIVLTQQNIQTRLSAFQDAEFVVYHDAFQYFERAFNLRSVGAFVLSPDMFLGAKQVMTMRQLVSQNQVRCLIAEPQFLLKLEGLLGTDVPINFAGIDPLGTQIPSGIEHWFRLMHKSAKLVEACFKTRPHVS